MEYVCTKCKETKPESEFGRFKSKNGVMHRRTQCNTCRYALQTEYMRRYRAKHPETALEQSIKESCRQLKLNFDVVWPYYQAHNGLCEICNKPPKKGKRLVLDHNHVTGEFRGLLCNECNRALGYFRDCPNAMGNAVAYVQRSCTGD